jgi:hypothetical protein
MKECRHVPITAIPGDAMNRSIAALALVLVLFAVPHTLAAGAPAGEEAVASPAVENVVPPPELDRSVAAIEAAPLAACPGGFTILRLFPSGTPQQACVDYCTASGATFVDYDQSNALYWVCTCCAAS